MAQGAGLAVAAVVLGDAEAAAIAVATLFASWLLRRRSRSGALLLMLLFADTAFFTAAAAISNLADGATLAATIGPAALAAIAMPGLLAAIATLWLGPRASQKGGLALAVAAIAVVLFVSAAIGSPLTTTTASTADPGVQQLGIKNVRYSTAQLVARGASVTIRVTNGDLFWHTFTIDELGVSLKVPVGAEKEVTFRASPGTYTFYCEIPGHRSSMNGTLTISP